MEAAAKVEKKLDEVLVKKSPVQLPDTTRKQLAQLAPWAALIFGLLQLAAAYWLWDWGRSINKLVDITNSFTALYGVQTVERLNLFYWLSLIILALDAILLLVAFPALQKRQKAGWDFLFYAAALNAVYGVVSVFNNRGSIFTLATSLLFSTIGLFFLFQIRSQFTRGLNAKARSGSKK